MATFPIYGQMDKETKAGAVAKSIMAKTIQADMVGANTGIEAGSVMCYNVVAFSGYGAGVLNSASSWFTYGASSATVSHMRLTPGVAPTSPVDGDIWYDGTNLKMRVGGTTKTFTLA